MCNVTAVQRICEEGTRHLGVWPRSRRSGRRAASYRGNWHQRVHPWRNAPWKCLSWYVCVCLSLAAFLVVLS